MSATGSREEEDARAHQLGEDYGPQSREVLVVDAAKEHSQAKVDLRGQT